MEKYLVGGAVRDFLLLQQQGKLTNAEQKEEYWNNVEKDWVVVGATPQEMLAAGYRQVGKSFPVFLHPKTQEEYALARTERKTGKGYTGFECYAAPDVTLEEDLKRRDLTINAIAMHLLKEDFSEYELIDPYGGKQDLENGIFRHVSPAFSEDPVRILRIARLAARFATFNVAPETNKLMQEMVDSQEVDSLVPERVWQEWCRSLHESSPWRFFEVLDDCQAKGKLFPTIRITERLHKALHDANAENEVIKFAIELFELSPNEAEQISHGYRIPNDFSDLALLVTKHHKSAEQDFTPESLLTFFEETDAFRRRKRFEDFIAVLKLVTKNESLLDFASILTGLGTIDNRKITQQGLKGLEFAQELRIQRLAKIKELLKQNGHFVSPC